MSSTKIMSSNISYPLQKKSDNPSIMVRKTSWDLDETKKALVTTTHTVLKEGNAYMGTKPNVVSESITPPIEKKKIDTVNKTEKSQASIKKLDTSSSNRSENGKSLDKSRYTQRPYTENTINKINKSRSNSRTGLSNKSTKIEKPLEIDIINNDLNISVLSGQNESLSSLAPDQQRIPRNNKRNKTSVF